LIDVPVVTTILLWTASVWADDQWLVEHAGATLKKTGEENENEDDEEADSAAEKHTEATVETVSNSACWIGLFRHT